MMNIEQITSRLAQMPDQALQKYAMMNKEDPYIMALAISESRRRKQMRTAAVPQPQAQPKVADQALMEMAPESVGIGQLPAGDMNFAGGGIVAFADGGDVERYQTGGMPYETPYDRMNRLNRERAEAERRLRGPAAEMPSYGMDPMGTGVSEMLSTPRQATGTSALSQAFSRFTGTPEWQIAAENERAKQAAAPAVSTAYADETRRGAAASAKAPPAAETTPPAGLGATPEAAAARRAPAAVAAPAVSSAQGAKDLAGQFLDTKGLRADLDKFQEEEKAAVEAARKRREEGKPEGKAYSKYEEMLLAEEGKAGKERDDALGVSIFKAGLAMMAGTSPNAFANIGKGATAGLEEYSAAMKDMKKAAKERQKAFADIENARRAEARDDYKAKNEFEEKADTRLATARREGIKGIMDITGKSAEIAARIYDRQVSEQGATTRAQMQVAAMQSRSAGNEDRQQLNELKALQTSLKDQLKDPRMMGPGGDPLRAQLAQVNAAIAQMAGLSTMPGAPGAQGPGGTSLKYNPVTGKIE